MLQPGEDSPHVRRRLDFLFGIPCSFRPGCPVDMCFGSRSPAGGRSLRRIVSGWRIRRTRARMTPLRIPVATLPWMLPWIRWEPLWRWWVRSPATCTLEGKIPALGTSLFRRPFPVRGSAVGLACGTCPESGGLGTGHVWISLIRYSSALVEKSGSSPLPFRYSPVWIPPLAPQPLAGCAQPPPLLLLHTGSRSEIRVDPDTVPASGSAGRKQLLYVLEETIHQS